MPVWVTQAAGGVVAVLEVAAGDPDAAQRSHQLRRVHPVAGLGVHGHGHVDTPRDARGRGEHLVDWRTLVILVAERGGDPRAGRGNHGKPSGDHGSCGRHIPHVRKQEGRAGPVQRPQQFAAAREIWC